MPLIIGTNKNEAALFRLMRSPLMPITPRAITSMFNEIAAEQPDLQLPTEEQLFSTYRGKGSRTEHRQRCRIPDAIGLVLRGHSTVAPVYLYRFDYASPLMKLLLVGRPTPPSCPMSGALWFPQGRHPETRWHQDGQG